MPTKTRGPAWPGSGVKSSSVTARSEAHRHVFITETLLAPLWADNGGLFTACVIGPAAGWRPGVAACAVPAASSGSYPPCWARGTVGVTTQGRVAAQLGHAKPTTTLTYYAHWIPSGDKRHIDWLETLRIEAAERVRSARGSNVVAASDASESEVHEMTWSRGRELNPRPTDYESVALPLSYPGVPVWSLSLASTPHHLLPCWFQQLVPRPARS